MSKLNFYLTVSFGELELSNLTFWSLVAITVLFVVSFVLSTIPLTKNISSKNRVQAAFLYSEKSLLAQCIFLIDRLAIEFFSPSSFIDIKLLSSIS